MLARESSPFDDHSRGWCLLEYHVQDKHQTMNGRPVLNTAAEMESVNI